MKLPGAHGRRGRGRAGSGRCNDALLRKRFNPFQTLRDGVIGTPGDNDWTDCHRPNNGNGLPTGSLARFRDINYPVDPADSHSFHVDGPFAEPNESCERAGRDISPQ